MTILFVLVPLAILLTATAVGAFAWSVAEGQLDDLTTPALRVLEDEEIPRPRAHQTRTSEQAD
jgi:cbb3-type cytochrome oxidase maturation protein